MVAIRKVECPTNKIGIKCPYKMTPTRIVIHNTASNGSAQAEIAYMHRNGNTVSFHFAVDDNEIVQGLDLNRNGWHAGDGNGKGNREGIGIEICYSYCWKLAADGKTKIADEKTWKSKYKDKFEKAQRNAAELTAKLLKDYGWGIEKVTKHQDYSGKHCPHRTLDDYGWDYFLNLVKGFMGEKTETTDTATKKEETETTSIKKGCKVKVNKGAKSYNGVSIAAFVYNNVYTVDEVKGSRAVLDKNGICTAFNVKDLTIVEDAKTTTKEPVANVPVVEYYPKYSGDSKSLVDALKSLKIDASFNHRKEIAKANGFTDYTGKAAENSKLRTLLKNGKLIKE